ncbi:MAG: hypothetical protein B7Z02_08305 [Rhodobacterales bacterium 32-67-9]|nr:MAG: hypothetical protein B7Z02_08305 [Rhodobacterales bacterium 32-67-9]
MKLFFRIVLVYAAVSLGVIVVLRYPSPALASQAMAATRTFGLQFTAAAIYMMPLLLLVPFVLGWRRFVSQLGLVGYAVMGSVTLQVAFSFLKSAIPMIVPFYADRALADADRWLHGGADPWELAHRWTEGLPVDALMPVYLSVWTIPAVALALVIAVSDRDAERTARFVLLYLSCWIVLGNLFALAGSSVGPVFYDALIGGDRFAGLHRALAESGLSNGAVGGIQSYLWTSYTDRSMALASGISAFPSVHVSIATLTAIYMAERSRWLLLPGLIFVATIQFLSVYTGYHYALDGYFSMLFVVGFWAVLRRIRLTGAEGAVARFAQVPDAPLAIRRG